MESAQDYLKKLEKNLGKAEALNNETVVFKSKMIGQGITSEDNMTGPPVLSENAQEAMIEYETRNAQLSQPSSDDSSEMDDEVAERMADKWIDKILELM